MENITAEQRGLLDRLKDIDPALTVTWDDTRGVAGSIRGRRFLPGGMEPQARAAAFLRDYAPLVGPAGLPDGLLLVQQEHDNIGWYHLLYGYTVQRDIEVYGVKLVFHFAGDGELVEVQSNLWRELPELPLEPHIPPQALRERLIHRIDALPSYTRLYHAEGQQPNFPFTSALRLVVLPWLGEFHLAWSGYGYSDTNERAGLPLDVPYLTYGHLFVDANSGERLLFAPTQKSVETPATGTGSAVTPLTGGFGTRNLNVVRVDLGNTYRLKDTTHERKIITYDTACDPSYNDDYEIGPCLNSASLPVSEDTEGDHAWDCLPGDSTTAQRTLGQQPEVDAHHFVRQQYEWYKALDGRLGWDDRRHATDPFGNPIPDRYPDPPVPDLPLHILAHSKFGIVPADEINACEFYYFSSSTGRWVFWLQFADGDYTNYDYMAGSRMVVAHEYQHAITDFSFQDAITHAPGLEYTGWQGAVHEGFSDAFGCLSSEDWRPLRDIRRAVPAVDYRTIVYPRDTAAYSPNKLDHYDDRNTTSGYYARGTILAHCAYLMGKGGVHQRAGRSAGPTLIPVYSLGRETVGGKDMLKAARIWYRALDKYCGTISNDQTSFRTVRNGCIHAAEDLYGLNSKEYCNTVLAFYAVGLPPVDPPHYGPDVTFLRWGEDWDLSRGYVGLSSSDHTSLDLFINNGGASEWNAQINVVDPATGLPTKFENTVYCRVRNVGDQTATNVQVTFEYAKAGTATWLWQPVLDKNGSPQTLSLGNLAGGALNFTDANQNTPPAAAAVKWCIPPLAAGEMVHHFCLRATVTANNDVNPYNNDVQSNIFYTPYVPGGAGFGAFIVGNPPRLDRQLSLDLRVKTHLPEDWRVEIHGVTPGENLMPGEMKVATVTIEMPPGAGTDLQLPLDGDLRGKVTGDLTGTFTGSLTETDLIPSIFPRRSRLIGQFAGTFEDGTPWCGRFEGRVSLRTGLLSGTVTGPHPSQAGQTMTTDIDARLRPWRRVEISQWAGKQLIGGVTMQVQVPGPRGRFGYRLPPTETEVTPTE